VSLGLTFTLTVLLVMTHLAAGVAPARAAEHTICREGPPSCTFTNVQAAVDAAIAGDVIKVAAGVYTGVNSYGGLSQVVYISRSVTIRGGYTTTNSFAGPPDSDAYPST
jgi:pectin methylesterase-like acyl-CoA thioesterase